MLGTKDFALPTFLHLCESGAQVVSLITQPDRPQGRKQELIPSRIKLAAMERGIPVFQPEDVNAAEALDVARSFAPDLLITAAYGQILSAELLGIPGLGGINLHGSILPKYRGASPVARAIEKGDAETGVTVIRMTPRIDAGGMIAFAKTPIDPNETAGELEDRLAILGAPLILQAVEAIENGTAQILPQETARVTRALKLTKEDGLIDWSKPATAVHNHVRAMQPWPTAYTLWQRQGETDQTPVRLIIHKTEPSAGQGSPGEVLEAEKDRLVIAAGEGAVRLLSVQVPGKKAFTIGDFLRGHRIRPGDRLGS